MLFKVRYTNTVLKICQNRRLYMKIICCKLLKLCLHSETIESWCRGFLTYEITMPWLYCLSFSMLWCFSFLNLDVASFWSWNLDVVCSWSWDLNVVVYVTSTSFSFSPWNIKQNRFNHIIEKYFNYPSLCNGFLYNACINELE